MVRNFVKLTFLLLNVVSFCADHIPSHLSLFCRSDIFTQDLLTKKIDHEIKWLAEEQNTALSLDDKLIATIQIPRVLIIKEVETGKVLLSFLLGFSANNLHFMKDGLSIIVKDSLNNYQIFPARRDIFEHLTIEQCHFLRQLYTLDLARNGRNIKIVLNQADAKIFNSLPYCFKFSLWTYKPFDFELEKEQEDKIPDEDVQKIIDKVENSWCEIS